MNTLSKLSLLACAFISVTACNEKVSPELKGASASSGTTTTTSGGTVVVTPDQYYFRVVNKMDTMLNFKLHKTGAGNANSNCEITNKIGLSSDLYRANPTTYDISCYFEAEELSLSFNGLSFAIEASSNTCPYIGYSPFSYYKLMPGMTNATIEKVVCDTNATDDFVMNRLSNPADRTNHPCDSYQDSNFTSTYFTEESDDALCRFKYPTGENCDTGVITLKTKSYTITDTGPDDLPATADDTYKVTNTTKTIKCGGAAANCIQGPIKQIASDMTSLIEILNGSTSSETSKVYTLPKILGVAPNYRYANYRRDLASLDIEYGNSNRNGFSTQLTSAYMASFGDPIYSKSFNPELMEMYASNKKMNGSNLVTNVHQAYAARISSTYTASPTAAEPYLGFGTSKTSPFYTFYCFDNAYDVRARIRMVVRDWDRVLPPSGTSSSFERISDVDSLPPIARQDVPYTDEVTGDVDSFNSFNDKLDWDDIIDMEREDQNVPYDPSITVWRTYPAGLYTQPGSNGFFNPGYFPGN